MKNQNFWLRFSALNFLAVAVLGLIMRVNFVWSIPFLNQKFLLEAHSHFAFYGWITQTIYFFAGKLVAEKFKRSSENYHKILVTNAMASYGMLISFFLGGYFWLSIIFSSIALFTGFAYCWLIYRDTKNLNLPEIIWLRAGAFFAVISSIGIFGIAFSAHKPALDNLFRASTHFYLHYQYNGFFIFSCIGFFIFKFNLSRKFSRKNNSAAFWLLCSGCLFGYGLSILWLDLSIFIKSILFVISLIQVLGSLALMKMFRQHSEFNLPQNSIVWLFAIVFLLKILLQVTSCIPGLQTFIFGDRSAIVAYLHLVLLCGISVFLFWLMISVRDDIKNLALFFKVLAGFIVLNQIFLFAQCFAHYFQITLMFLPKTLIIASLFIVISACSITFKLIKNQK